MTKILVVDDEPTDRMLMATVLGTNPEYEVFEAVDGQDGLNLALKIHPDLIITDVKMPKMNGYQLAMQVRMNPSIANTEMIYYTGIYLDKNEAIREAAHSGIQRILLKPVEPIEMLSQVTQALAAERLRMKLTCPKFIADIDDLIRRASELSKDDRIWDSAVFIRWRKATADLINLMASHGCNLGSGSLTRYYHGLPIAGTVKEESAIFENNLKETIAELSEGKSYFERRLLEA